MKKNYFLIVGVSLLLLGTLYFLNKNIESKSLEAITDNNAQANIIKNNDNCSNENYLNTSRGSVECYLYKSFFEEAYQNYPNIPRGVLEAVSNDGVHGFVHITESMFNQKWDKTTPPRVYTVMRLINIDGYEPYFKNNLQVVSNISGYDKKLILESPRISILAYAKALSRLLGEEEYEDNDWNKLLNALSRLDYIGGENIADKMSKYRIIYFLSKEENSLRFNFPLYKIDLETLFDEETLKSLSSRELSIMNNSCNDSQIIDQTILFPSCNFSTNMGEIDKIAIHTIEGTTYSGVQWFLNCDSGVSSHYVVGNYPDETSTMTIIQGVCENDKAQHIGFHNNHSIGIEHSGSAHITNFDESLYSASATLVKDIQNRYPLININNTYTGIGHSVTTLINDCIDVKGHQHFDISMNAISWKSDPGSTWDWFFYYGLINENPDIVTYNNANGQFYDSGGFGGNYSNLENKVYKIDPGIPNVTLTVDEFDISEDDYIWIFDKPNPTILPNDFGDVPIASYQNGNLNNLTQTSYNSTNGGFYIIFRSNCENTNSGFKFLWNTNNLNCADNYEPNDTQSQATPLYVFGHDFSWSDSIVDECLDQATADIDWYRMNLTHQGELTITLSSQQISSLYMDWLDNGNVTSSTTVNGNKQIVICSNNGPACYDTALRIYTVTQNGNDPIPYTLDIQWSANQSCTSERQSNTINSTQNNSAITINGNTSACEGLSNTLSISGTSGPFDWFVNGQSVHIGNTFNTQSLNTGQYDLFVIAADDVCSFAETQLNITSGVTANAGANITIQNGGSTTLQASGGTNCSWSPTTGLSNPNICTTTASPTQTTTYTLTVTENGCADTDTVTVTVDGSGGGNPPANDDCTDAITLTSSTSCNYTTGTVADATPSFGANNCLGCSCTSPDDYDVYYKFTAVETSHTVTVSNYASNFDAVIELRTACSSGSSNYISCYDPTGAPTSVSETWTGLTVDQTYYIRVFEWDNQGTPPNSDTFDICVTHQSGNTDGIDLISDIASVSNNNPDAGNTITINYTGSNIGDEPTTTLPTISFYLSTNTTLSSADDFLSSEIILQTISANEIVNGDIEVTLPDVADGQYYLVSSIDDLELIDESNENNNISFYAIQIGDVVPNGPDLDVRDVDVIPNSNLIPGQEVDIEVRIENEGTEDVGSFTVLVYFDINGNNGYDGGNEYMGEFTFNSLDAGDDETMIVDFDLPVEIYTTGNYEIFAIADSDNAINETNENNNDDDQNVTIGYVYDGLNDDVRVIDETIDITNVNAGSDVFVTSNHIYLGSQSDSNVPTLDLGYYLSTDCALSSDDIFLDDDSSGIGNDDPIKFEDQTLTIPPATPTGTYYILFVADMNNEVNEGALENNNVVCIEISVTNSNGANGDVYIADEICNPTDVIIGSEIEPYINVHYTGTLTNAELPSVAVYYYLSNDCTLSTDDILVSDDSISLGSDLPINDASDAIELPNNLSPGIYYIIFQADAENVVFETDENNNIACAQFNLLLANTNYQDVTFNSPYVAVTEATFGDQVYASIHQNYTGYQADADIASIRMEYYLSTDCMLSADDYYFTTDVSSLGYDDPSQFEFATLTIPTTISAGPYYILFVADTEDIIAENNESNNTECVPVTITETLGIEDNELVYKIKVYPNPVNDILTINLGKAYSKINIEVYNVIGQKINSLTYENKQIISVNTSYLSNGIYFFNIEAGSIKSVRFKIIKE